jgi:hypothetical protein
LKIFFIVSYTFKGIFSPFVDIYINNTYLTNYAADWLYLKKDFIASAIAQKDLNLLLSVRIMKILDQLNIIELVLSIILGYLCRIFNEFNLVLFL